MTQRDMLKQFFDQASIWNGGGDLEPDGGVLHAHIAVRDSTGQTHKQYVELDFHFNAKGEWLGTTEPAKPKRKR